MTVINLMVAMTTLGCGLVTPDMLPGLMVVAVIVALALAVPLALARRQGIGRDDARLTFLQWSLFAAIWTGTVLWSVTTAWSWALAWSKSFDALTTDSTPRQDDLDRTLDSLSTLGQRGAFIAWLLLVVLLSARLRGRRPGRGDALEETRPPWHRRWPDLVFILMVPGNLAIIAWVVFDALSGESEELGAVIAAIMAVPLLLMLLFISTLQAVRAVPWMHGTALTPVQAWLQIGLWASLGAVGAGLTVTTGRYEEPPARVEVSSAFLTFFPGAVDASRAVAWVGGIVFVALYAVLLISLRRRRLISVHERRMAARRDRAEARRRRAEAHRPPVVPDGMLGTSQE